MKKYTMIALVLIVALSLCACRMGSDQETIPNDNTTTEPRATDPTTPATDPTIIDPTIIDPTIAPNVPDPSVDDDHLIDPTDGSESTPDVRGRLN